MKWKGKSSTDKAQWLEYTICLQYDSWVRIPRRSMVVTGSAVDPYSFPSSTKVSLLTREQPPRPCTVIKGLVGLWCEKLDRRRTQLVMMRLLHSSPSYNLPTWLCSSCMYCALLALHSILILSITLYCQSNHSFLWVLFFNASRLQPFEESDHEKNP